MASTEMTLPRRRLVLTLFGILLALFVGVNVVNALHKGSDFTVYLEGGRRFLNCTPLYEGSAAGWGVTGPPFHSVLFAPFAAIAETQIGLARLLWYFVNVFCLLGGVWCQPFECPGRRQCGHDDSRRNAVRFRGGGDESANPQHVPHRLHVFGFSESPDAASFVVAQQCGDLHPPA